MKTLAFVFLLFVLSCKSDVVEPMLPDNHNKEKSLDINTLKAGQVYTEAIDLVHGSARVRILPTGITIGGHDGDRWIDEKVATQDWVIKSAITLGTYKHKTFGGINVPCQELIINGEKTGLYVLSPDK